MTYYLKSLLGYIDDEYEYIYKMRELAPRFVNSEDYIIGKEIDCHLGYVFDAFNECCRRIEENSKQ